MKQAAVRPTLIERLWPSEGAAAMRTIVLVVLGTALLTASAKVQVPMWPVPMTMQSFVVLVIGMAYGARLAAATVALYLIEGAFGLPVFAGTPEKGVGLAYMVGPTGGYLLGFLVAAAAMGWLAERGWDRSLPRAMFAMAIGTVLLFAPGVAWLVVLFGAEKAVAVGVVPFILGSVVKLGLAAAVLPLAWKAVETRRI
ncbi:MAG TPA: biotin transporter BioY [Alphaproteobacteria bacterium]